MAIYPCEVGPHAHRTRNILVYAGFLTPDGDMRSRARVCQLHWRTVEPHLVQFEVTDELPTAGNQVSIAPCATCGEPVAERGTQLFITAYPTQNDRKDYWLQVHDTCGTPDWLPWRAQAVLP